MAEGSTGGEAGQRLVGGCLTASELLSLADEMLERGVLRFEYATGLVEFAPSTLQLLEAKKAQRDARDARARKEAETGSLRALTKREADQAKDDDMAELMRSA